MKGTIDKLFLYIMFIFNSLQIQNFNTISNDLLELKSDKSKSE
jgi:hypothetical protein